MNTTSQGPGAIASMLPAPTVFVPGSSELPASLAPDTALSGPLLLLIDAAENSVWAGDAAVAIAAAWAGADRRVVLADLHLEEPVLHERVGEPNLDGVVDIFLYGASVARSARPPSDHRFFLIPAGTYTATPADVYGHPRWRKLLAGFREADATLMGFVPGAAEGIEALAGSGTAAVWLGRPAPEMAASLADIDVLAVLAPPTEVEDEEEVEALYASPVPPAIPERDETEATAERPASEDVAPTVEAEWQPHEPTAVEPDTGTEESPALWALQPQPDSGELPQSAAPEAGAYDDGAPSIHIVPRSEEPATAGSDSPPGGETSAVGWDVEPAPAHAGAGRRAQAEGDLAAVAAGAPVEKYEHAPSPLFSGASRRRRSGPGPLIWLLVGAVILIAAVLAAVVLRPDLFGRFGAANPATQGANTPGAAEAIPPPPAAPVPVGDTLAYAVQVRAYVSLEPARTQAERQARRVPQAHFYVVPELTQGVLYYKVMAGLLPDTTAATELRRQLIQNGVVAEQDARDDAPGRWNLIQARPLAFHLGEFADRTEALARSDSLVARGIPTYPVPFPYSDGTERYRLYAGAFPDSVQAEELRQMLRAAEIPARLVPRIGRVAVATP
jgi:hypothetical protein